MSHRSLKYEYEIGQISIIIARCDLLIVNTNDGEDVRGIGEGPR